MPILFRYLKDRWFLILLLLIFIVARAPYLSYAFYWDEAWPYATAVNRLYHQGISLMPSAIDAEYSRGHPLFFHAAAATWMKIFGTGRIAMHSFPLFVSALLLISVYEAGLRVFNKRVAIIATLLLAVQAMFFIQSTMLLPEMLVAFLAFAAIYFYVATDRYIIKALLLSALFLTKESGLFIGFIIGLDVLARLFRKDIENKRKLYDLIAVSCSIIVAGLFFLAQKYTRGWYIFPLYNDLIQHNWNDFYWNFRISMQYLFSQNYAYINFFLLFITTVVYALRTKDIRFCIIALVGIVVYLIVSEDLWEAIPTPLLFSVFTLLYLVVGYFLRSAYRGQSLQQRYIVITGLALLAYMLFSSMNLMLKRYLLTALPLLLLLLAVFFDLMIKDMRRYAFPVLLALIAGGALFIYTHSKGYGDTGVDAFDALYVQQEVITFLEEKQAYSKRISAASFLTRQHLTDKYTGFLRSDSVFRKVDYEFSIHTQVVIFDNIEFDGRYAGLIKDHPWLRLTKRIEKGDVWAEVYERVE